MPFLRPYNALLVTGTTGIRIPIIKRASVDFAIGIRMPVVPETRSAL